MLPRNPEVSHERGPRVIRFLCVPSAGGLKVRVRPTVGIVYVSGSSSDVSRASDIYAVCCLRRKPTRFGLLVLLARGRQAACTAFRPSRCSGYGHTWCGSTCNAERKKALVMAASSTHVCGLRNFGLTKLLERPYMSCQPYSNCCAPDAAPSCLVMK